MKAKGDWMLQLYVYVCQPVQEKSRCNNVRKRTDVIERERFLNVRRTHLQQGERQYWEESPLLCSASTPQCTSVYDSKNLEGSRTPLFMRNANRTKMNVASTRTIVLESSLNLKCWDKFVFGALRTLGGEKAFVDYGSSYHFVSA